MLQVPMPGSYVRATQLTVTTGGRVSVDLSFLDNLEGVDIDHLRFLVSPKFVASLGAAFKGEDAARLIRRVDLSDVVEGARSSLAGPVLRAVQQFLMGDEVADPADGAADATITDKFSLFMPFGHRVGVKDERDVRVGVAALKKLELNWASNSNLAPNVTIGSGTTTVDVLAYVVPRRNQTPEAPARIAWQALDMSKTEDHFTVGDQIFAAFLLCPGAAGDASGNTSLLHSSTGLINSTTLGFNDLEREVLIEDYRRSRTFASKAENVFLNGDAIPLVFPRRHDLLSHMPFVKKLHLKLAGVPPTGTQLVLGTITENGGKYDEVHTGVPATAVARVRGTAAARVATRDGRKVPLARLGAEKARRIPTRYVPTRK